MKLLDQFNQPMSADERQFWENNAACCLSAHNSVPDAHADVNVVKSAFEWADVALELYRKRLQGEVA